MSDDELTQEERLAEVVSMREKFAEDNEQAINALLGAGLHPMAINHVLLKTRLETLIDALLPQGMNARDAYETAAVVGLRGELTAMMEQVRQAALAPQSQLIVPTAEVPPDLTPA